MRSDCFSLSRSSQVAIVCLLAAANLVSAPLELSQSRLTSPIMNAVTGDTVEFAWTASEGAEAYQLWVGTAWGASDLHAGGETLALSTTLRELPRERPLYARLRTKVRGVWYAHTIIFQVGAGGAAVTPPRTPPPPASPRLAQLLVPGADGLLAPDRTLRWSPVEQAEVYYLWVGSAPGTKDVYQTGETKATAVTAAKLPANRRLYARLHTKLAGQWRFVESQFMVVEPAVLTHPKDRGFIDGEAAFRWPPVEGAEAYRLSIGRSAGGGELHRSAETTRTELTIESLPFNEPLHARLETKVAGHWHAYDCRFINVRKAFLLKSVSNGPLGTNLRFQWQSVERAERYYLWLGSKLGSKDLYESGETLNTSVTVQSSKLPIGLTIYARMHTKVGQHWHFVDSTLSALSGVP